MTLEKKGGNYSREDTIEANTIYQAYQIPFKGRERKSVRMIIVFTNTSAYLTPQYCLVAGKVSPMQTHLYEHSMMYGDASPHEYRQTLVESYLNHYSKEVEALDEASTLSVSSKVSSAAASTTENEGGF